MQKNRTVPQFLARVFLPVIALELGLLPFWFLPPDGGVVLPTTQLLLTGLLLPVYLAVIGGRFIWNGTRWHILIAIVSIIPAIVLALFLDYFVWGVWSGLFWHPDGETVMLEKFVGQIGFAVALIPLVLTTIFRYARLHSHRRP